MAGVSSKALAFGNLVNKEKTFQGQKFDDELGLNWIEFKWRNHDPQIGRFIEIDPIADQYLYNSTYAFSENKITNHVELEGLEAVWADNNVERDIRDVNSGKISSTGLEERAKVRAGASQLFTTRVLPGVAVAGLAIAQPQLAAPLVLSYLTGVPVTPSPQALEGVVSSESSLTKMTINEVNAVSEEKNLTLYRGVNESSPAFEKATQGIVTPRGGSATALEHNMGNTNSPFTSWTTDLEVAKNYALRPDGKGVVLTTNISKSAIIKSPSLKNINLKQIPGKIVNESEVLIEGKIKGCKVQAL